MPTNRGVFLGIAEQIQIDFTNLGAVTPNIFVLHVDLEIKRDAFIAESVFENAS